MKKKFFIKLLCAVFASSFLIMACQPTKDGQSDRRQRNTQYRQMDSEQMMDKDKNMQKMPMKKQYNDGEKCCPKSECDDCGGCEWCCPRCEESTKPEGIYAPREPMKKKCPECPPQDACCDPCSCCDDCCDDCCGDCCDDCGCDPCDDCGCNDCCCDPCDSCCESGRKYTRDEIFGRDSDTRQQNRNDPRRYSEK